MALPTEPPRYSSYSAMLAPISRKSSPSPWATYALQRALGVVPATGVFGDITDRKLRAFQKAQGLEVDGIAGQHTQETILELAGARADQNHNLPMGVGYGFATAEGGNCLAASNWSRPGGVDCGPAQWRILGPPYNQDKLRAAFRPYAALDHACRVLAERRASFSSRNSHLTKDEALRVAILAHNWPVGADRIVRNYPGGGDWWRYVPSPDADAEWVDGFTHAEWAREYPKRILQFVA